MATENTLLEKLEGLVPRFEEVSTLITDPNVIADQKRYVQLTKEYKNLEDIMKARQEYINAVKGLEEAKEMLTMEDDPEMKEMAREEIAANEKRIPELEEEIKLLLIPTDPEDSKNVTLEIRGGTGGDEAALFAGDLFRMYSKYCEIKGWHLTISSFSEGAVGGYKEIIATGRSANRRAPIRLTRRTWLSATWCLTFSISLSCTGSTTSTASITTTNSAMRRSNADAPTSSLSVSANCQRCSPPRSSPKCLATRTIARHRKHWNAC